MSDQTNGDLPFKYGQPMEDGFVPDKTMTEIVHAVVKNFDDELRNTPDYTKRRNWHLGKVGEIIGAKIASGELMVVKTVSPSRNDMGKWECTY